MAKKVFIGATAEEVQKEVPADKKGKMFRVADPTGKNTFVWARNPNGACAIVSQHAGYKAFLVQQPATAADLTDAIGALSAEERQRLLQMLTNGAKAPAAPATPAKK